MDEIKKTKWYLDPEFQSTERILIAGIIILIGLTLILQTTKSNDIACYNYWQNYSITHNQTNQSNLLKQVLNVSNIDANQINAGCFQGKNESVTVPELNEASDITVALAIVFIVISSLIATNAIKKNK